MKKIFLLSGLTLLPSITFAAPWDFLRGGVEVANIVSPLVAWIMVAIALGILLVSVLAVRKKKSRRLMLVSVAFGIFFIKAILNIVDLYCSPGTFMNVSVQGIFDFLMIMTVAT